MLVPWDGQMSLVAGEDYPGFYAELRAWFDADWKCADSLDWLRWPLGFVCPGCAHVGGWRGSDGRWRCAGCDRRVSATAGTIFHHTRTPLTIWFAVAWQMISSKVGVSATQVQREMGLGSDQTAWAMLHRYRPVMARPGRDRLCGDVEVDESYLGGPESGVAGRGALGKVLIAGAVERGPRGGFGRARLAVIPDASAASLRAFLIDNVEPGARVITDGWSSYPAATREKYEHHATTVSGSGLAAHEVLPAVHTVLSLVKRWVMGTLQGSVSPEHLPVYFDEWVFRLQPPPLAQPRAAVPPPHGPGRHRRRGHLQPDAQGRTHAQRPARATTFYDFPAEHWRHLRTTNPIESAFATVKLRTRVTKGAGSKAAALAMAYKLREGAQDRGRKFNAPELVADVLDGVQFNDGERVKTDTDQHTDNQMIDEKVAA